MADLSPELAARIQALEASYAGNRARYFVALAGAWREGGDIARAEEILRENVRKFPGLSAHVLLGRCLADRGAFQEAANEFHYVLSIDSQNLIALRTLAEMSAAGGRRAEAERWYHELLAVDPMNAEARSALASLARAGADAAAAGPQQGGWTSALDEPPPSAAPEEAEFGMIDLSAPDASPADTSGAAADDDAEWGDLPLDLGQPAAEPAAAGASGGSFDAFGFGSVDLDADPAPASDGWIDADTDARQDVGESAAADTGGGGLPLLDDDMIDAPLAGAGMPLLDDDPPMELGALADEAAEPGAGSGFESEARGEEAGFLGFAPPEAADDHADHGEHADHEVDADVVTETMAELYAAQGLHERAADVYRELIQQRGREATLVRRLAEIEAMLPAAPSASPDALPEFADADEEAPDWLTSVEAFASGASTAPAADAGRDAALPDLDFAPSFADETTYGAPEEEPAAQQPASTLSASNAPASYEPESYEPASYEPASAEPAGESASADPFADSFAGGFEGAAAEPAAAGAGGDSGREQWQAPSVTETEPVAFDILVIEDEDGAEVPAPPEIVADYSADWAIAAAPLEDDEEEAEMAAASASASAAAAASTMRDYFASLLAWQPGASASAAAAPAEYVVELEEPSSASPAAPAEYVVDLEEPAAPAEEPWTAAPAASAGTPVADEPWAAAPESPAEAAPVADEPWAAAPEPAADAAPGADEPWAAGLEASSGTAAGTDEIPLLELEEPWTESPAAPRQPADIGTFELADDVATEPADASAGEGEELLPWEVPAAPSAAASGEAPAAQPEAGGFSFEDFFSAPAAPAPAPAFTPEPAPAPAPQPEPEPAFIPSFAAPTPPPAPPPAPAPAAPAPAAAAEAPQDEDDEDLESFQAWLQSLKR